MISPRVPPSVAGFVVELLLRLFSHADERELL